MTLDDFKPFRFGPSDFEPIGGYEHIDAHVVALADEICDVYGHPLIIVKGWTKDSGSIHSTGQALHLETTRPDRARHSQLVMATMHMRCGGFGIHAGHIHIDIRSGMRGSRWIVIEGTTYEWTWTNLTTVIDRSLRYS